MPHDSLGPVRRLEGAEIDVEDATNEIMLGDGDTVSSIPWLAFEGRMTETDAASLLLALSRPKNEGQVFLWVGFRSHD